MPDVMTLEEFQGTDKKSGTPDVMSLEEFQSSPSKPKEFIPMGPPAQESLPPKEIQTLPTLPSLTQDNIIIAKTTPDFIKDVNLPPVGVDNTIIADIPTQEDTRTPVPPTPTLDDPMSHFTAGMFRGTIPGQIAQDTLPLAADKFLPTPSNLTEEVIQGAGAIADPTYLAGGPLHQTIGRVAGDALLFGGHAAAKEMMKTGSPSAALEAGIPSAIAGASVGAIPVVPKGLNRVAKTAAHVARAEATGGILATLPALSEGRLPTREEVISSTILMGLFEVPGAFSKAIQKEGVPKKEADVLEKNISDVLGPRPNTSQSFVSQPPRTPIPPDINRAGERAPITTETGQVRPSEMVAQGASIIGEGRRQSQAFEAKGTPVGGPTEKAPVTQEPSKTATPLPKTPAEELTAALDKIIDGKLTERGVTQAPKEVDNATPVDTTGANKPPEVPPVVSNRGEATVGEEVIPLSSGGKPETQLPTASAEGSPTPASSTPQPVVEKGVEAPAFKFAFQKSKYDRILKDQGQEAATQYARERGALPAETTEPLVSQNVTKENPVVTAREKYAEIEGERDVNKLREFARNNGIPEDKVNWSAPPDKIAHSMASHLSLKATMDALGSKDKPSKASTGLYEDISFGLEHIGKWTRQQLAEVARRIGVAVRGTTEALRKAVGEELRRIATEEAGAIRTVFHGSDKPFTKFDESRIGTRTDPGFAGRGAYTTTSKEVASRWGKHVLETKIDDAAKWYKIKGVSELYKEGLITPLTDKQKSLPQPALMAAYAKNITEFTNRLKDEGYEGVEWTLGDGSKQYVLFKPGTYTFKERGMLGELTEKLAEESGMALLPGSDKAKKFVASLKRLSYPRTETGKPKPRGTLREEKLVEKEKGQQSFIQELNDTLVTLDEGPMTIAEMVAKGEGKLTEPGAAEKLLEGKPDVVAEVSASNILTRGLVGDLFDLAKRTEKGSIKEKDFQAIADKTIEKIQKLGTLSTGAARAVRLQATMWSPQMMQEIATKLRNEGKRMSKRDRAAIEKMLTATNAESVASAYNSMKTPRLRNYVLEYYYNNLLGGFQTLSNNFLTTALWAHAQIPLRAIEGGSDFLVSITNKAVGRKYTRQVYAGEFLKLLKGYYSGGLKAGAVEAGKALKGLPTKFDTQIERELAESSEAWSHPNAPRPLRAAAPLIAWPSRLTRGADTLFKGMAAGGEIEATLHRWTLNEAKSTGVTYADARKRIEVLLNSNTENGRALKAELDRVSEKFAHYASFNDSPNRITQKLMSARGDIGITGRLIVPFVNTGVNITARTIEFTPVAGIAKEALSRVPGIGHGGAVTPMGWNNIAAKQIASSVILMSLASMYDEDSLTGAAPDNPSEREAWKKTHQPYSIKINGKWYNYAKLLGPLSAPIATYAIWLDEKKKKLQEGAKDLSDPETEKEYASLIENVASYFFESSFMNQLYSTLGYGENIFDSAERQTARIASGLVPWNSATRSIMGTAAVMTGTETMRDAEGFWEYFRSQSPLVESFTGKVPGKLDVLGKELHQQGGVWKYWLPIGAQEPSTDPVEVEIGRVADATGFAPAWPSPIVPVSYKKDGKWKEEDVRLDRELYRKLAQSTGARYNEKLKEMFNKPYYKEAEDSQKAKFIGKVHADITNRERKLITEDLKKQLEKQGKVNLKKIQGFTVVEIKGE